MTADNFDRLLRTLQDHTPFHVFTVELNGGERFEVDYPNAMVVRDGVAVFLASAASDFVTGTAIPIDGGFSVQG